MITLDLPNHAMDLMLASLSVKKNLKDGVAERIDSNPSARQRPSKSHEDGSTPSAITNFSSGACTALGQRGEVDSLKAEENADAWCKVAVSSRGTVPSTGKFNLDAAAKVGKRIPAACLKAVLPPADRRDENKEIVCPHCKAPVTNRADLILTRKISAATGALNFKPQNPIPL